MSAIVRKLGLVAVVILILVGILFFGLASLLSGDSVSAVWKVPLDGGQIVVSGKVVYAGSADGAVYAFDLNDGKQIWSFQTGEGLTSGPEIIILTDDSPESMVEAITRPRRKGKREIVETPILKNGTIYVESGDMHFYALDASTGSMKWSFDAGDTPVNAIVSDRFVYFTAGGTVHALNATDGSEAWASGKDLHWPLLADGTIYLVDLKHHSTGTHAVQRIDEDRKTDEWIEEWEKSAGTRWEPKENAIRALDAESGKERWAVAFPASTKRPTVSGNLLLFRNSEAVYALDLSSGALVWRFAAAGPGGVRVLFATEERVFFPEVGVFEGSPFARLFALNKKTGELLWELAGDFYAGNILFDEHLYVMQESRWLLAVNADSGEVMWKTHVGSNPWIQSVVDGVVYASSSETLIAIDSVTGKKLWKFKTPLGKDSGLAFTFYHYKYAKYCSPPTKAGELLLFSTSTAHKMIPGHLYAIDSKTGKLKTK